MVSPVFQSKDKIFQDLSAEISSLKTWASTDMKILKKTEAFIDSQKQEKLNDLSNKIISLIDKEKVDSPKNMRNLAKKILKEIENRDDHEIIKIPVLDRHENKLRELINKFDSQT